MSEMERSCMAMQFTIPHPVPYLFPFVCGFLLLGSFCSKVHPSLPFSIFFDFFVFKDLQLTKRGTFRESFNEKKNAMFCRNRFNNGVSWNGGMFAETQSENGFGGSLHRRKPLTKLPVKTILASGAA